MLVMANRVLSEWFQYWRMRSTTSVMEPASFGVPSTLNTGTGLDNQRVVRRCEQMYSQSMKFPVAPESTREFMDLTSAVSVVSMLTFSFRDLSSSSVEAMMSLSSSLRSQRGRNCRIGSGFCTSVTCSTGSSISGVLSTDKTANQL